MSHQIRSMRPASLGVSAAFILLIAAHPAHADTSVYKYTGPDGVTVYSQTLPESYIPGKVQTVKIETLPVEQQRAAIRMLDAMENKVDAQLRERHSKLQGADQRIDVAIKNLQQAETALQNGSVPTGDDRIGKVGGGSRFRESYFQRVSQLQAAVAQARIALDQAYSLRDLLR
ncbi:MAG: DUF4124 domain-containing protein [Gallionella sp.]